MSTVVLDTITGKSTATTITIGSTPVVSASANSMTIRGEGSAQTSIQQGLGKTWVNFKGTDTFGARDSLNVTSLTDGGAGNYTVTIANDMANINYCSTDSIGSFPDAGENFGFSYTSTHATGSVKLFTANSAADANVDFSNNNVLLHGDLA
tara:strand:- start:415 stop:867 length:453 start_codon:yes stop_codon:yes gene_type:complete